MGYVYKITNTVNNKAYIGISIHEPETGRIKDHLSGRGNRIIANAVKKYGKDAFTYEILEADVFDEFLPDLEVAYIANFNTVRPHGYNLTYGGEHGSHCEETRLKLSKKNTGKKHSTQTRLKISKGNTGKKRTKEMCLKMSESRMGEKHHNFGKPLSDEHRLKISKSNAGRKHSAQTRLKLSKANSKKRKSLTERHRFNISEALKGKNVSTETRFKISKAKRHPDQLPARDFFLSLPFDMSLTAKRKLLYNRFPNVSERTIRQWVQKWTS